MTGYQGRRLRKNQRRLKNAFVARPCRFHRWRWYDWGFGILTFVLSVYALVTLILVSVWINDYRTRGTFRDNPGENVPLDIEIQSQYSYRVGLPIAISLLVALFYLLILTVLILIWLRYFRNIGYFLILLLLVIIGIIFFLTIGGLATTKTANQSAIEHFAFDYVTEKLKKSNGMTFVNRIYVFSVHNKCCGIRDYQDWKTWDPLIDWPQNPYSVPIQCCKSHEAKESAMASRNECGNMEIFKEASHSVRLKSINTRGCGFKIVAGITSSGLLKYAIHGLIIGLLLFIFLLLFLCIMWCLSFGHGRTDKWVGDPHDHEDLTESDIVPGTPAKSMMSESENTFYAP